MKEQSSYVPPRYIPLERSEPQDVDIPVSHQQKQPRHNHNSQEPTQWSSGICACFDDMPSCCLGLFCPCIIFGKNAEFLGSGTLAGSCMTHFILWVLLSGLCCLVSEGVLFGVSGSIIACYACGYRGALRSRYNLQEAPCGDLTTHLFCHLCALCQEYREIHERTGNLESSALQLPELTPPSIQIMEHDVQNRN